MVGKTLHKATRVPLQIRDELVCSGRVIPCPTYGKRRVTRVKNPVIIPGRGKGNGLCLRQTQHIRSQSVTQLLRSG